MIITSILNLSAIDYQAIKACVMGCDTATNASLREHARDQLQKTIDVSIVQMEIDEDDWPLESDESQPRRKQATQDLINMCGRVGIKWPVL